MNKVGAILLVAGTCIGSGMIALPMVLAKLGLVPSILLMLAIWFVMYYTSLINLELNLQAGLGLPLGELGKLFSGRVAELIGTVSLKLLSYALLAVFIYGGSSIVQKLVPYSFESIATGFALAATLILLFPIKWIDYINRLLFINLLAVVAILVIGLALSIDWSDLPLFSDHYEDVSVWVVLMPVVFNSFGFQVIFHTLTNYCRKDVKMLKRAFFWGSLIPAVVYILWTSCILSVVYHENAGFYHQMAQGNAEVGELIQVLSGIAEWKAVQLLVWAISLLAIVTSIIGVGLGLFDSIKGMIPKTSNVPVAVMTIGPAYLTVLLVPNAFITVLGFAGMMLAIIAILLPVYLFWKMKTTDFHYDELRKRWLVWLSVLVGMGVIACELYNMRGAH